MAEIMEYFDVPVKLMLFSKLVFNSTLSSYGMVKCVDTTSLSNINTKKGTNCAYEHTHYINDYSSSLKYSAMGNDNIYDCCRHFPATSAFHPKRKKVKEAA